MQYLPIAVFAICILIAFLLVVVAPSFWPAALAIAISGGALALGLRSQNSHELGYLTDDITVLQEQNRELRKQVAKNVEMIDELADVVEQIATLTADGGDITRAQVDSLRDELTELRSTDGTESQNQDDQIETRLTALESQIAEVRSTAESAQSTATPASMSAPAKAATATAATAAVAATAASASDTGQLRSLMARVSGGDAQETTESDPDAAQESVANATLSPVFRPERGSPVAFILQQANDDTLENALAHVDQTIRVAREMEETGKEVLLFVRLSPAALADGSVRDTLLQSVNDVPALQRRLTLLTSQDGFGKATQETLAVIAAEGCKFALYGVRDWSLNLAALARDGMGYILVDGPAMVRSAQEQGGDPRRLTQALDMHKIALIGGEVASEEDIASVNTLEPALITGEGLGATTSLGAAE